MNWKFSCEIDKSIPLPPEYTFPRAFNYLNDETNSFFILEGDKGYIQVAGSKQKCTVEFREYDNAGSYKHYVFFNSGGSDQETFIKMTNGGINRQEKHCFGFLKAALLFKCYFESEPWPNGIEYEDISHQL